MENQNKDDPVTEKDIVTFMAVHDTLIFYPLWLAEKLATLPSKSWHSHPPILQRIENPQSQYRKVSPEE